MDVMPTVTGNLTADPVQRLTASGLTVVTLRVAASSRRFDRDSGQYRDGDPMFINVTCWRALATNVFASLRKGDGVVVYGRLSSRVYDDKAGVRRSVHEIDAVAVGPDLSRCPVELRRPQRPADADRPAPAAATAEVEAPVAGPDDVDERHEGERREVAEQAA